MRRIVVVGTSGAGKSTLAQCLARSIHVSHIELDELHWGPNWTPRADFAQRVERAVQSSEAWVIAGNYSVVRPIVWAAADTIIWLDYPMSVVFSRVFRRTMSRCWTGEPLWAGNRERFWLQFCSQHSILLWCIQTWRKNRRDYPKLFREPRYRHLRIIRCRSVQAADEWLLALADTATG